MAAEKLAFLSDEAVVSADEFKDDLFDIHYLRAETYRKVLEDFPFLEPLVTAEVVEPYLPRATAAFNAAEKVFKISSADIHKNRPDWRVQLLCGRTLVLFVKAVCLQQRGRVVEAAVKCNEAIASAELLVETVDTMIGFMYRFGTFL
jgi:hypothetical protein